MEWQAYESIAYCFAYATAICPAFSLVMPSVALEQRFCLLVFCLLSFPVYYTTWHLHAEGPFDPNKSGIFGSAVESCDKSN